MRILLAGPLPHGKTNGGVAIFTKNLAVELYNQGYSVQIISSFNGFINNKIRAEKIYHVLHVLHKFKPDIIISSLAFSGLFIFTSPKIIKIHLLHGFTNFKNYNFIKVFLMQLFDRIIKNRFDYILANSNFTRFINEEIFNIRSDGLFRIGLDSSYIKKIQKLPELHKSASVLYVGRMVDAKNVKLIYKTFCNINNKDYHLNFVGYGPDSSWLISKAKNKSNISFLGFKLNYDTINYYRRSKVFVSLNPAEPYGITFLEALLNNDFIIAPDTGGQVDLLKLFPKRCRLVNVNNVKDVESAIKYGLHVTLPPFLKEYKNINDFTYNRTWNDIKRVIDSGDNL